MRVSLDRGTAIVSGSSSSHNFLLIAGVIGLLVILVGIVVVLLLLKHKRVSSREEPGDQRGLAFSNARPEYAQEYSRGTISAEQDPWPWAKKISPPPVGYNPTTPVPEVPVAPSVPVQDALQLRSDIGNNQSIQQVAPVVPVQDALQQPPILVPDPTLEAIMRQVQVGLFAMPVQHKGQKDREAVL